MKRQVSPGPDFSHTVQHDGHALPFSWDKGSAHTYCERNLWCWSSLWFPHRGLSFASRVQKVYPGWHTPAELKGCPSIPCKPTQRHRLEAGNHLCLWKAWWLRPGTRYAGSQNGFSQKWMGGPDEIQLKIGKSQICICRMTATKWSIYNILYST